MSLYVRVQCSFYTHRKTAKLRARLGDDALWIPPRIWAYAAEHQPDGDFSRYEATELAVLIGYTKDACSMLEALQGAEFFDGMKIHGWDEHNEYHATFSERAKKAAAARWEKERSKEKAREGNRKERKVSKHRSSNAQAMLGDAPSINKARGTLTEIADFTESIGMPRSDGEACFHKWEGKEWKNGGEDIKDWRATIRSWKAAGYLPSQKQPTTQKPNANGYQKRTEADRDESNTGIKSNAGTGLKRL